MRSIAKYWIFFHLWKCLRWIIIMSTQLVMCFQVNSYTIPWVGIQQEFQLEIRGAYFWRFMVFIKNKTIQDEDSSRCVAKIHNVPFKEKRLVKYILLKLCLHSVLPCSFCLLPWPSGLLSWSPLAWSLTVFHLFRFLLYG